MPQASNSLDRDQIAGHSTVSAQGVERRNSGAHQWSGFRGIERFWHVGHRLHRCDHVFLVAAVVADPADDYARAIREIAPSACQARPILAAKPANSNAIAFLPPLHAGGDFIDYAGDLVSGDARIRHARKPAL